MTNMTLAIPEDLHKVMRKHKEIKWSEVARQAMMNHAQKLDWMDKVLSNSELTEEDAERIGNKMKHDFAKRIKLIK